MRASRNTYSKILCTPLPVCWLVGRSDIISLKSVFQSSMLLYQSICFNLFVCVYSIPAPLLKIYIFFSTSNSVSSSLTINLFRRTLAIFISLIFFLFHPFHPAIEIYRKCYLYCFWKIIVSFKGAVHRFMIFSLFLIVWSVFSPWTLMSFCWIWLVMVIIQGVH